MSEGALHRLEVPTGTCQLLEVPRSKKLKVGEVGISSSEIRKVLAAVQAYAFYPITLSSKKSGTVYVRSGGSLGELCCVLVFSLQINL